MREILFSILLSTSLGFAGEAPQVNLFASSFYHECDRDQNLCFSPYSLFNGLFQSYLGAKGDTSLEMQKALHLPEKREEIQNLFSQMTGNLQNPFLQSANSFWIGKEVVVRPSYFDRLQKLSVEMQSVDFLQSRKSVDLINDWVSQKTQGKIDTLLSESDVFPSTKFVLANTVYFQGLWAKPFSEEKTIWDNFYTEKEQPVLTRMMKQSDYFSYYEDEICQLVLLPIRDSFYCCFFILPKIDFVKFEENFSVNFLQEKIQKSHLTRLELQIPKFSLQNDLDTKEVLQKLGIKKAFGPHADFSEMTEEQGINLSKVLHQVSFSIDEKGVEAAAATALTYMQSCVYRMEKPIPFVANHPFLFGVLDQESDVIFFLGRLIKP